MNVVNSVNYYPINIRAPLSACPVEALNKYLVTLHYSELNQPFDKSNADTVRAIEKQTKVVYQNVGKQLTFSLQMLSLKYSPSLKFRQYALLLAIR